MLPSTNRPRELTSAESTRNFMRPTPVPKKRKMLEIRCNSQIN